MAPKKKPVQKSLEQVGQLPTLKKPIEAIGKTLEVIGAHWGSACPSGDKDKIFSCTINDFTLLHVFSPTKRAPAFQLTDMGTDGLGGNSERFWMEYPYPFLEFYWKTFPTAMAAERLPDLPADAIEMQETTPPVMKSRTLVYDHLDTLRSEKIRGRQKNVFTCKVVCQMETTAGKADKVCGQEITLYGKSTGPFFKHVRRAGKRGCSAHAALTEVLNTSSERQVRNETGEWVTVFNFKESFPHHMRFAWMVAAGLPIKLNRNRTMRSYIV